VVMTCQWGVLGLRPNRIGRGHDRAGSLTSWGAEPWLQGGGKGVIDRSRFGDAMSVAGRSDRFFHVAHFARCRFATSPSGECNPQPTYGGGTRTGDIAVCGPVASWGFLTVILGNSDMGYWSRSLLRTVGA
jgi:hypothetical protein